MTTAKIQLLPELEIQTKVTPVLADQWCRKATFIQRQIGKYLWITKGTMHVLNVFQGIAIWQIYRLKDNIENILNTSEHHQSQSETILQNKKCDDRGAKNRNWHYLLGKERKENRMILMSVFFSFLIVKHITRTSQQQMKHCLG